MKNSFKFVLLLSLVTAVFILPLSIVLFFSYLTPWALLGLLIVIPYTAGVLVWWGRIPPNKKSLLPQVYFCVSCQGVVLDIAERGEDPVYSAYICTCTQIYSDLQYK